MKKILIYYNFIIVTLMVLAGFSGARDVSGLITASLFYPIFIYFLTLTLPKRKKAIVFPQKSMDITKSTKPKKKINKKGIETAEVTKVEEDDEKDFDMNRRAFIKLIGSAGVAAFIFSVFGLKKAQAAFFGSVRVPGIVGVKDSAGAQIDPAEKHPTDGYQISRLDDSSTPSYYGFTNKDAEWFIMKEDSSGNYTYAVGSTDFSTNWTNRDQSPPTGPTYQEYYQAF